MSWCHNFKTNQVSNSHTNMFRTLIIVTAIAGSATAFAPSTFKAVRTSSSARFMSEVPMEDAVEEVEEVAAPVPVVPTTPARVKAQWLPVGNMMAPKALDGSLAGDVGFDPAGFAKNENTLLWMREAELKHSRLAMLAAVGWPLSELWHKNIAGMFGLESILAGPGANEAPSLLNGGLNSVYASGMLMMSLIFTAILEGQAMNKGDIFIGNEKSADYVPGDFGFDPLNLKGIRGDTRVMETMEIKNGRLAMLAITFFAFSEFVTKVPVVQQTPFLF